MFHITLACEGVPPDSAPQCANDIVEEFTHWPWHQNVNCTWHGRTVTLTADNDFDANGLALLDEFSDAIVACVGDTQYTNLRVVEVKQF